MTDPLDFGDIHILVVGDVMLDRYWWGDVNRISPEAPVPIIILNRTSLVPGGAANVAANVAGLGAVPVLIGCIGEDQAGEELVGLLNGMSIDTTHLARVANRPTTIKTRIIAHSQHVARVDNEVASSIPDSDRSRLLDCILDQIKRVSAIVISDYAKGVVSEGIVRAIISEAKKHDLPVVIDPKGKDYSSYNGASVLTPNRKEAAEACNLDEAAPDVVLTSGRKLLDEVAVDSVLITQGGEGMTLFSRGREPVQLPAAALDVFDVTGAGDTVIASLAVSLAAGNDLPSAAGFANVAAGLVVGHVGTTPIRISELRGKLENLKNKLTSQKKGLT